MVSRYTSLLLACDMTKIDHNTLSHDLKLPTSRQFKAYVGRHIIAHSFASTAALVSMPRFTRQGIYYLLFPKARHTNIANGTHHEAQVEYSGCSSRGGSELRGRVSGASPGRSTSLREGCRASESTNRDTTISKPQPRRPPLASHSKTVLVFSNSSAAKDHSTCP